MIASDSKADVCASIARVNVHNIVHEQHSHGYSYSAQDILIDRLSSFTQQSTKVLFSDHRSLAHESRVVRVWFMLRSCPARLFISRSSRSVCAPSCGSRAEVHGHGKHLVVFVGGACSSRKRLENCKRTYQYRARVCAFKISPVA